MCFGGPEGSRASEGSPAHLQPLGAVVGGGGPGVGLALLVQPGVVGVPGEGLDAPGAVGAGRRDLAVGHQAGLHPHRLRAACRRASFR